MDSRRKISVVLQGNLFQQFTTYCANQGYKKSPLIARLIREHMDEEGSSDAVKRDINRIDRPTKKR
jgi:metal-responsive CopG/Arc/MetJ family transcriptional regulator